MGGSHLSRHLVVREGGRAGWKRYLHLEVRGNGGGIKVCSPEKQAALSLQMMQDRNAKAEDVKSFSCC